jgi:hypothetical protein
MRYSRRVDESQEALERVYVQTVEVAVVPATAPTGRSNMKPEWVGLAEAALTEELEEETSSGASNMQPHEPLSFGQWCGCLVNLFSLG